MRAKEVSEMKLFTREVQGGRGLESKILKVVGYDLA